MLVRTYSHSDTISSGFSHVVYKMVLNVCNIILFVTIILH